MNPATKNLRRGQYPKLKKHPVKLTALLYLQEALLAERYEDCGEMIETALEFGAKMFEIRYLLEDPRRIPRA